VLAAAWLLAASGCARPTGALSGRWQLTWQGRIGAQRGTLSLQQHGSALSGTLRGASGAVPLSGSVNGARVWFAVSMAGPPPYGVAFAGSVQGGWMRGQAQPLDVQGRVFAGHAGEVSSQYYSWTAQRMADASGRQD
jgi:hypothetical protein